MANLILESYQKFGFIIAETIDSMRNAQRLKVVQVWKTMLLWKNTQFVLNGSRTHDLLHTGQMLLPLSERENGGELGRVFGSYVTCFLHLLRSANVEMLHVWRKRKILEC